MTNGKIRAMFYRDGKLFLASLWRALLLSIIFALICGAVAYGTVRAIRSGTDKPLSVAVVDEEGSLLSRIGIRYVSNQKNIAAILAVDNIDRAAALEGLASGRYSAAVILPENYLNAIMVGDYVRGKILLANGIPVNASLMKRLASAGENLIRMGQYGVFAGARAVLNHLETKPIYDLYLMRINDSLIYEASTAAERYLSNEETAYSSSSLPLTEHAILMGLLCFLSLSTLFFYRSATADLTPQRTARLRASGITAPVFLAPKIVYSFAFRTVFALLLLLLLPLFGNTSPTLSAFPVFFTAVLILCTTETFLSVALAGNRFGVALFSLLFLAEMFFVGGILPLSYLSDPIRRIGSFLPLGLAARAATPIFGGVSSPISLLWLSAWLIPAALAALWRMRHICREGGKEI